MAYEERGGRPTGDDYDFTGYQVYDMHYEKIGKVDDIFVGENDDPEYIGMKVGLLGSKTTLIPMGIVRVNDKREIVEVAANKDAIEEGPTFSDDREITPEFQRRVLGHYGVEGTRGFEQGGAPGASYPDSTGDERVDLRPGERAEAQRAGAGEERSSERRPGEQRSREEHSSEQRSSGASYPDSTGDERVDLRPGERAGAGEERSSERRPGEQRSREERPSEQRSSEQRSSEQRSDERHPGEQRSGEGRPDEPRFDEERPGERRSGEEHSGERRPSEERPGEERPSERRPASAARGDVDRERGAGGEDDIRVQRVEEELRAGTRERDAGEMKVRKRVRTERERLAVPKKREEVRVERVPVEGRSGEVPEAEIGEDEILIPIVEEEVVVEKRPVVKEEIRVRKDVVEDEEVIEEDVRKEEVEIDDQTERGGRPGGPTGRGGTNRDDQTGRGGRSGGAAGRGGGTNRDDPSGRRDTGDRDDEMRRRGR